MNTVKNFNTIHLRLYEVDVVEVVMTCLIKNKVRVPDKTEDLNLSVFNMIIEINESKTLTKHKSKLEL